MPVRSISEALDRFGDWLQQLEGVARISQNLGGDRIVVDGHLSDSTKQEIEQRLDVPVEFHEREVRPY